MFNYEQTCKIEKVCIDIHFSGRAMGITFPSCYSSYICKNARNSTPTYCSHSLLSSTLSLLSIMFILSTAVIKTNRMSHFYSQYPREWLLRCDYAERKILQQVG